MTFRRCDRSFFPFDLSTNQNQRYTNKFCVSLLLTRYVCWKKTIIRADVITLFLFANNNRRIILCRPRFTSAVRRPVDAIRSPVLLTIVRGGNFCVT